MSVDLKGVFNACVAHFLTDFDTKSPSKALDRAIRERLSFEYQEDVVAEFIERFLSLLQVRLVEEFNERVGNKNTTLRFEIVDRDGEGNVVKGRAQEADKERLLFQDALNELDPGEFESLSAYILGELGCEQVWKTPHSHDQGIDAFGYRHLLKLTQDEDGIHKIAFLAQAKHYKKTVVGSKEIREFVGSVDLAVHKIYATQDDRYPELVLRPFGPITLVFMTSEEIPHSVKRMATNAGVVTLSSDDLFRIIRPTMKMGAKTKPRRTHFLVALRKAIKGLPLAVTHLGE